MISSLSFIGNDYEEFVELFTVQTKQYFGLDTSNTYFDCTNFYFEIDREDDFRKKGPSKELRKDPIIGLGLLLDSTASPAKREEYGETEKYVNFTDDTSKKVSVTINQDAIDKDLKFAGYNLLITSETEMSDKDIYNTYHNLWRIEESFKIMKSDLDARPVFLQKEDTIKCHFLICYLTVLLERIFQFKVLNNEYSTSNIFQFIKDFRVTKGETKYINTTKSTDFICELEEILHLPLTNYFLSETQIKTILYRNKQGTCAATSTC